MLQRRHALSCTEPLEQDGGSTAASPALEWVYEKVNCPYGIARALAQIPLGTLI